MNFSDLKNKQHIKLPVAGIDENQWGRKFFLFRFDDLQEPVRVGMFKYQEAMHITPGTELPCYVKEDDNGSLSLVQDYVNVFADLYKEGETYDFIVKRDFTDTLPPCYAIADDNGFQLNLPATGIEHLYVGKHIRCRVTGLYNRHIRLQFVPDDDSRGSLSMLTAGELLAAIARNDEERGEINRLSDVLTDMLAKDFFREAVEAYRQEHGEWVFLAIAAVINHITTLVSGYDDTFVSRFVYYFRRATLYLLEESDFICNLNDEERGEKQRVLADTVRRIDAFTTARQLIAAGGDTAYVSRVVGNLRCSGYLYEPERVFTTLMFLFRLKPRLMDENMQPVFDVITSRPLETWTAEPFRSAFVTQLKFYVDTSRHEVDNLANMDNADDCEKLDRMVTALGILRLLDTDSDSRDACLYASMLYRYLTLYRTAGAGVLFNLSYAALTGCAGKINFTLADCSQPIKLAFVMSVPVAAPSDEDNVLSYAGKHIQADITASQIVLHPLSQKTGHNALPQKLQTWKNIRVISSENITGADVSLKELHKQWLDVERSLVAERKAPAPRRGRRIWLEKNMTVKVYVDNVINADSYSCRFVDDDYNDYYDARLNVHNIVHFKTSSHLSYFMDEQTGRPFIYEAVVINVSDNSEKPVADLSMMKFVDEGNSKVDFGEEIDCLVMADCPQPQGYVCLDAFGLTVILQKSDDCPDDIARGSMVRVRSRGFEGYRQIQADFVDYCDESVPAVTAEDALRNVLQNISDETLPEPDQDDDAQDDVLQEDNMLSERQVEELIHIIDRKTVMQDDYRLNYHYLYLARLLALMTADGRQTAYLDSRLKLLEMLDNFAINHVVDTDSLEALDGLESKVAIQSVMKLKIIDSLDNQKANGMLWGNINNASADSDIRTLSRLALSYNLLSGLDLTSQCSDIRHEIDEILHFNTTRNLVSYGEENETREFKTSLVYPPDNHMQADIGRQTETIRKVICAFLNTDGGTLYLGVNDYGVPVGLQNDLVYGIFRENHEHYASYLRNQINASMHDVANSRVSTVWQATNGKEILVVKVEPSPVPVKLNGTIYVRRGAVCNQLKDSDADDFIRTRPAAAGDTLNTASGESGDLLNTASGDSSKTAISDSSKTAIGNSLNTAISDSLKTAFADDDELSRQLCQTGRQRNNVLDDYLDNYITPIKYLTLCPHGRYEVSDDRLWPDGRATQLAVHEDEKNGFLVLVYKNGYAVKVPMKDLIEKNGRSYQRYDDQQLLFASPAAPDDCLLLFLTDVRGNVYYRSEPVDHIVKDSMRSPGKPFTTVESTAVYCDIIPRETAQAFKSAQNMPPTTPGYSLKSHKGDMAGRLKAVLQHASLHYNEAELSAAVTAGE